MEPVSKKLVICVTGKQGSGKTTVSEFLVQVLNGSVYMKTSEVLIETLRIWHLPVTSSNMQKVSDCIRSVFGQQTLAHSIKQRIDALDANVVILDGLRGTEVFECMQKYYKTYLIYLESDSNTRFERMSTRVKKGSDDIFSKESFIESEKHRTEQGVTVLKSVADHVVENDHSIEKLKDCVTKISTSSF